MQTVRHREHEAFTAVPHCESMTVARILGDGGVITPREDLFESAQLDSRVQVRELDDIDDARGSRADVDNRRRVHVCRSGKVVGENGHAANYDRPRAGPSSRGAGYQSPIANECCEGPKVIHLR